MPEAQNVVSLISFLTICLKLRSLRRKPIAWKTLMLGIPTSWRMHHNHHRAAPYIFSLHVHPRDGRNEKARKKNWFIAQQWTKFKFQIAIQKTSIRLWPKFSAGNACFYSFLSFQPSTLVAQLSRDFYITSASLLENVPASTWSLAEYGKVKSFNVDFPKILSIVVHRWGLKLIYFYNP